MSVANDIARTYRTPRTVLRRRVSTGATEGRALAILLAGCLLMFVAQWPGLSRAAFEDPSIPVEARIGGALIAWLFMMPLVFYILAALSHLAARMFSGQATWLESRMALFWALSVRRAALASERSRVGLRRARSRPSDHQRRGRACLSRLLGGRTVGSRTRSQGAYMTFTLNQILAMVGRTVQSPREGASELMSLGISRDAVWTATALVVVLSTLFWVIQVILTGGQSAMLFPGMRLSTFGFGLMQLVSIVGVAGIAFLVGRAMGGTGSFPEALLLMTWLQFIMICITVIQVVATLLLPPVGTIIVILSFVLSLWLLTNFIAELHGFRSLAQVFIMILVTAFAVLFFMSLALSFLGVALPTEAGGI